MNKVELQVKVDSLIDEINFLRMLFKAVSVLICCLAMVCVAFFPGAKLRDSSLCFVVYAGDQ